MQRDYYGNKSSAAEQAEYLMSILPDLDHLDLQELLTQQESAYEYYNFGLEHGESSNRFNESGFVDDDDDDINEALARSLATLDVNDGQSSPHNTGSNVTELAIGEQDEFGGTMVRVGDRTFMEYFDYDSYARAMMATSGVDVYEQSTPNFYDVGNVNEGLSKKDLSKLSSSKYKIKSSKEKEKEQCVICCAEFKNGDKVITLACKHVFHSKCIIKWLEVKKHCPLCQREVKRK
ncbi:RING-type E3 ubiquitin transferase [Salvia divinorum]|uniref:RING-type E3 ubiquitin transferase n=1 Tax=Salvia divinorum TaxID=28513 RepID=A0ABD1FJX0_SALDI